MTLHPASLLMLWLCLSLALQWQSLPVLTMLSILILPLAMWRAGGRLRTLLRRARWLLLSIVLLFAFATPGILLSGLAGQLGMTSAGLVMAATHALRLLLLLALLALLLEQLGVIDLIAGLYTLLAPLGASPRRGQIALRLLLVLEYVEQGRSLQKPGGQSGWQYWLAPHDPATLPDAGKAYPPVELDVAPLGALDRIMMLLALISFGAAYWWARPAP